MKFSTISFLFPIGLYSLVTHAHISIFHLSSNSGIGALFEAILFLRRVLILMLFRWLSWPIKSALFKNQSIKVRGQCINLKTCLSSFISGNVLYFRVVFHIAFVLAMAVNFQANPRNIFFTSRCIGDFCKDRRNESCIRFVAIRISLTRNSGFTAFRCFSFKCDLIRVQTMKTRKH